MRLRPWSAWSQARKARRGAAGKAGHWLLTMFGVTTPCVQQVVKPLQDSYDCLVFHATGIGGQAMEKLVDAGKLVGVIDVSTTEVCDMMMGGVFPATEDRFGAVIRTRMPYIGSVGALDMVNFGAPETVPERYKGRDTFYPHNPQVTLMRTTAGGVHPHGPLDRPAAQPDGRSGALLPARRRRLGARCASQALPRPDRPRGAVHGHRTDRAPDGLTPAHPLPYHINAPEFAAASGRDRSSSRSTAPAVPTAGEEGTHDAYLVRNSSTVSAT
jgi:hypothetical protein